MPSSKTLAGALAFATVACTSASPAPSTPGAPPGSSLDQASVPRDPPSQSALAAAVSANNAFALGLYAQIAPTAAGGNLMSSPLSASLALTMTYAGAQGQTASEMASVLHLPAGNSAFDGQNALSQALNGRAAAALADDRQATAGIAGGSTPDPTDYALDVVNSVWGQRTYTWATPFLDILARSYGTGVYVEDFAADPTGAMQTINDWVSSATADKIQNLLLPGSVDASTRLVLVNAVHLKLPWASPFQPSLTASGPFTRGDGSQVTAPFMHQGLLAAYAETDQAQVVSLPLAGNQLSVVFALPKADLASLIASLTPETWGAMTGTGTKDVVLSLPKFTFTSKSFSLADAVKTLGMKTAFDPANADFKGLCASPPDGHNLYIGDVLQKATMAVAEQGVEAAAATAVLIEDGAAPASPLTVTVDHPFLVSIVDGSGAIVFMGQIDDPTDTGGL
jgi:serpin B